MKGRSQCRKTPWRGGWAAALLAASLAYAEPAAAASVTTIIKNGRTSNRVDIVILGDGYQQSELPQFAQDAANFVNALFNKAPFDVYQHYFNVHRVDVVSAQSGADHPENGTFVDTAFDATYNCGGTQRTICVNSSKVFQVLDDSVTANQRDIAFVLVNDTEYGGSGGAVAVASINQFSDEIAIHEIGHSFGLLADEYVDPALCTGGGEPSEPNATRETSRSAIKWNSGGGPPDGWIEQTTPVPTTTAQAAVPGLYEGSRYCASGIYRPTHDSLMRSLERPFEQINEEQLVKRIYNFVSPLDDSLPRATKVSAREASSLTFSVIPLMPTSHALNVTWRLDGITVGSGTSFTLATSGLTPGVHGLSAQIDDPTGKVRNDPANLLSEQRSWQVRNSVAVTPWLFLLLDD